MVFLTNRLLFAVTMHICLNYLLLVLLLLVSDRNKSIEMLSNCVKTVCKPLMQHMRSIFVTLGEMGVLLVTSEDIYQPFQKQVSTLLRH